MRLLMLLSLLTAPMCSFCAIYRCTVDGSTTVQDRPCVDADTQDTVHMTGVGKGNPAAAARLQQQERFQILVAEKTVAIGMSANQVRQAWGAPNKINRTIGVSGVREQWVYPSDYVYFDSGIVSTIQMQR